jgi:2-amino-4-hydroxy-6-hydroxymethyldihydropteridine diphosphokinase
VNGWEAEPVSYRTAASSAIRRNASYVALGLGANLGDPPAQLAAALRALRGRVRVDTVSSLYRSAAVGGPPQPDYLNLVCVGRTMLDPLSLLEETQRIEREIGREPTVRDGPRVIDVDLLAYGARIIDTPRLTLPHPRLAERTFVLRPLVEIAPEWRHPSSGLTARELLERLDVSGWIERWGLLPA